MLSVTSARSLLAAARDGSVEILGALEDSAVLVVEMGPSGELEEPVPAGLPCVVLGFSRHEPTSPAPAGTDIAVCSGRGHAPPGWVAVADLDHELVRLSAQVGRFSRPAVVLAQLLRTSADLDTGQALVCESLAYSTLQSGPEFGSWLANREKSGPKARSEPEHAVLVDRRGSVLEVTLNRPHVRNAVSSLLRDELAEALTVAAVDPSVMRVDLGGAGPDFCSGGDLDEFGTLADPATAHLVRTGRSPARVLGGMSNRVVAHLHGACIGAGIELAAFAGTVVAGPDVRCQLPEVVMGLVPGSGGTVSIPRRIGRHRTAWLAIGTAAVGADTALGWGLVDEVVEHPRER